MAKILVKFNGALMKEWELTKDETSFGRKPGNDLVIDHPTISGYHGKIRKMDGHYFVEDLNSTNGTFLNGHRIKSGALKDKDLIGAATHLLEFNDDVPAPSETDILDEQQRRDIIRRAWEEEQREVDLEATIDETKTPRAKEASIRVIDGAVDNQVEITLTDTVSYIGASPQSTIRIKGFFAPERAAVITRKPEGFVLKAIQPGYPKVNGNKVQEQIFLDNGALIEAGATHMVFYLRDGDKKAKQTP